MSAAACVLALLPSSLTRSHQAIAASEHEVALLRVPDSGLQPRAVIDSTGVHVVYFNGEPSHGDVFYTRLSNGRFAPAVRVNTQAGSAIATGNVRGPSLALGRDGRVHVAWMGSDMAPRTGDAAPMLYARSRADGTFEPERNVHQNPGPIDGGSIGADRGGHVYIAWHSESPGSRGESNRRAWVAHSNDDGTTFAHEAAASPPEAGACGCCGTGTFVDTRATLYVLFRSARETSHREAVLLTSSDRGATYTSRSLQDWQISACPMSTFAFAEGDGGIVGAWESTGQVYWARVDGAHDDRPIAAPGSISGRKHPSIARNARGETLLAWTEGMGWSRGGTLAWQLFDRTNAPIGETGRAEGVPAWSLVAAFAKPDGTFAIVY
ncbi:MAG: hypothetical protein DMF84_27980 [Acidobacteria bacterium]|nr:MAG: hypothetical protein DMF84_27980 [Acidobacteriota bacterium]